MQDFAGAYTDVVGLLLAGRADEARSCLFGGSWAAGGVQSCAGTRSAEAVAVFGVPARRVLLPVLPASCGSCSPLAALVDSVWGGVSPITGMAVWMSATLPFGGTMQAAIICSPPHGAGLSDMENLVTACYMCNSIKQNWLVEELRWEMQPVSGNSTWDGLSARYPRLLSLVREEHPDAAGAAYFMDWLRVVTAASSRTSEGTESGRVG